MKNASPSITAEPFAPDSHTTAAQYRAAAASSLRIAIAFREEARTRCALFDRRVDRHLMRDYALDWRRFTATAAALSVPSRRAVHSATA